MDLRRYFNKPRLELEPEHTDVNENIETETSQIEIDRSTSFDETSTSLRHTIKDVKESQFFSVIADEPSEISGTEQLSLGARFVHKTSTAEFCVREEFLRLCTLTTFGR
ncbi:Hypothetical protein CINCED_3A008025 [Cinara cedri]|uniref:Uncharacterized protein n=1 Tax=Cinara cedri TaxID=506608 RepID=A0A5E4NLY9_9HEMI|nr:Hypothetical protein CINCED_3A008025 [Cinara cedri]